MHVTDTSTPDHSLALSVADELCRLEANLRRIDPDMRGVKQLARSVSRLRDVLAAHGYEVAALAGVPYADGMRLTADFVDDPSLPPGSMVIASVSRPQVSFNGRLIQAAHVTVACN